MSKILIIGDSYSTYAGYIPEGYSSWYVEGNIYTDVTKVEECWWRLLAEKTKDEIVLNDSWSGTTICNTGYEKSDATSTSYCTRFENLVSRGFFKENKIDTIIVFGGTNDSWADAPIGSPKYDNQTKDDLFSILPAACHLFKRIKEEVSNANVICLINTELKEEIMDGLEEVSKHYGVRGIRLKDIAKNEGHPTVAGMKSIFEQTYNGAKEYFGK